MTKNWIALPMVALVATGVVACSDSPVGLPAGGPNFELVDLSQRIVDDVDAWVFGSFILSLGGGGEPQPILVPNGESNFPGNPKNAGRCEDGTWFNPKGVATGGNRPSPHPHCIAGWSEGESVEVILEPISAAIEPHEQHKRIRLAQGTGANYRIQINIQDKLEAAGVIEAYAMRADNEERVGRIRIDLGQYSEQPSDLLIDCDVDGVFGDDPTGCVKYLIDFTFTPDGGDPIPYEEEGFLWWVEGKDSPFRAD